MELTSEIIEWAMVRGIFEKGTPEKQVEKTLEEANEIKEAIISNDLEAVIDGIGDTVITLVILCEMYSLSIDECVESAYNEIKNRKGKMIDGTFVKDNLK